MSSSDKDRRPRRQEPQQFGRHLLSLGSGEAEFTAEWVDRNEEICGLLERGIRTEAAAAMMTYLDDTESCRLLRLTHAAGQRERGTGSAGTRVRA
ncbi:hypothetical protein ACFQ1S_12140 [Kibdelosporangium lantanae]|uniref:Uncharacterized protein n=1 Tax=Kibdelosporangium lantanae TaxID=1497396 RepID=A0ABW3M8L8_9PSEU